MTLSAIVLTYRTGAALFACLERLLAAPGADDIVVADNGNPEAVQQRLDAMAAQTGRLKVLRGHGNIGFAAGCNLAAAAARGDVLVFVNPDVMLEPDAPARLAAVLEAAPGLVVVGGDLRDGAGLPERGSRRERLTLWRAFVSFTGLTRFARAAPMFADFHLHQGPLPAAPEPVGSISGALVAMRKRDFDTMGGFDEGYFLHVEDIDLCRRVEEAGGRVLFAPGPHGVHLRSSSDVPAHVLARHKARSFARYFRKFARNGFERLAAEAAGAVLAVLLPLVQRP